MGKSAWPLEKKHWTCARHLFSGHYEIRWLINSERIVGPAFAPYSLNGVLTFRGGFASGPLPSQVEKAVPAEHVIFVVHQHGSIKDKTVQYLRQERFSHVPRVVLESCSYGAYSPELLEQATISQYSIGGAFAVSFDAPIVTLLGGRTDLCLQVTVFGLIREVLDIRNRPQLTLRLPQGLVWGATPDFTNNEFGTTFINRYFPQTKYWPKWVNQLVRQASFTPGEVLTVTVEGRTEFHLPLVRQDGKKVLLVLEGEKN